MIIVNLKGGLGNQMFQYATGLDLAKKHDVELRLDISNYLDSNKIKGDSVRNFDLDQFQITAHNATSEEIKNLLPPITSLRYALNKKVFKKYYLDYHPKLFQKISGEISEDPQKNIYLDGFFQSEKNFSDVRDELLKEFTLRDEFINDQVKDFQKQIERADSVSVHVRRGDYANDLKTNRHHGTCPPSYYREAIEMISESREHPHFFIFTDDIKWAEENLKFNHSNTIVSGNGLSHQQELYLMSKCKHNIIANSSFSWWGAWLNQNPNKNVVAPKRWTVRNTEHPNIIPDGWIEI